MKALCLKWGIKYVHAKQRVFDTDDQEKEAPLKVHLPLLQNHLVLPPQYSQNTPIPCAPSPLAWVCPLVKTGGEFRPTWIHELFSLLELREIKLDLGSYIDDPCKHMNAFQYISLAFNLTWKDVMVIFNQMTMTSFHVRLKGSWGRLKNMLQSIQCQAVNTHWGEIVDPCRTTWLGPFHAVKKD